ncbi:MAG: pirin family protein [Moraxellaceae bacterium]
MSTPLIQDVLHPHVRDLGEGFSVKRLLPAASRQMVGPFIFLDHMGPTTFAPGAGIDVRPHPHIGLATATYLFEGVILHRDSLGTIQEIHPGDVNWMTAGRGIAHSERTPPALRFDGARLHGLQFWVALPKISEQTEPSFQHHPHASLPRVDGQAYTLILIAGTGWGMQSPVQTHSPLFYADVHFNQSGCFPVPAEHAERALYVVSGEARVDGVLLTPGLVHVLQPGSAVVVEVEGEARLVVFGGAPLEGPRRIWWNFVASDAALIEQAKEKWSAQRFDPVPGETEFLPLPGPRPVSSPSH